jgi:hypothetical protein
MCSTDRLLHTEPQDWTEDSAVELNEIDGRITEGSMLTAEKKPVTIEDSHGPQAAQIEVEYWLKRISSICNMQNFNAQIERLLRKLLPTKQYERYDSAANYTIQECQAALSTSRRTRYKIMMAANNFRRMFLEDQAAAAVLNSNDSKENILKCLIQAQERQEMYKRLHHMFKLQNTGAISYIEVRTGDWQ